MNNNEKMKQLELLAQGSYGQRIASKAIICMTIIICVFCISCASVGGYVAFKTFEHINSVEYAITDEYSIDESIDNAGTIIQESTINNSEVSNGNK